MARACGAAAVLLAAFAAAPDAAGQQAFPSRAIEIVNPYQPGSTTDLLARALSVGLGRRLGQDVTVVNKPGAGGMTGAAEVARADGDGHRLLFAPALVISVLPAVRPEPGYSAQSLAPVCQTFFNAIAVVARADSGFASLADLVRAAREAPGALRYGHPGRASIPHLAMEELLDSVTADVAAVSFASDQDALEGVRARQADIAAVVLGTAAMAAAPDLRLIGIFAEERKAAFPDVETVKEQGFEVGPTSFGGLLAPAKTPPQVVSRLAWACEWAAREEPYVSTAKRLAQPENYYANVATFRHRLQRDIEVKRRLLNKLGAAQ
jgi:tripartite-type tricarboxylate transporter receptor subunit TctC